MLKKRLKKIGKITIQVINSTTDLVVLILILLLFAFGSYAIWDSNQIYQEADASKYEIYKPTGEDALSFEELKKINSEVLGWINVYGTHIDYPLVQGQDDDKYINMNAIGEYSLAGSIFLSYRNSKDFSDFNNLIYGHHMAKQAMFGEIGDFRDVAYFNTHKYGKLYACGKEYGIEFFAFLEIDAYDGIIYQPPIEEKERKEKYICYIRENATHYRDVPLETEENLVLLSTCTSDSTNGRTVLVGRLTGNVFKDTYIEAESEYIESSVDENDVSTATKVFRQNYGLVWLLAIIILVLITEKIVRYIKRKKAEEIAGKEK